MKADAPTAPVLGSWGMGVQPRHSSAGERGFYGPARCSPCSARSTIALLSPRSEASSHPPASHAGSTRDPLTAPRPGFPSPLTSPPPTPLRSDPSEAPCPFHAALPGPAHAPSVRTPGIAAPGDPRCALPLAAS